MAVRLREDEKRMVMGRRGIGVGGRCWFYKGRVSEGIMAWLD